MYELDEALLVHVIVKWHSNVRRHLPVFTSRLFDKVNSDQCRPCIHLDENTTIGPLSYRFQVDAAIRCCNTEGFNLKCFAFVGNIAELRLFLRGPAFFVTPSRDSVEQLGRILSPFSDHGGLPFVSHTASWRTHRFPSGSQVLTGIIPLRSVTPRSAPFRANPDLRSGAFNLRYNRRNSAIS